MSGPLSGLKVIEMAGIGPGPFCGMMLADMGADVVRITREGDDIDPTDVLTRNRRVIAMDLRSPGANEDVLSLVAKADILIEGFRPGVMERLGLGPDECLARQPSLVYGRMTGWGQTGPLAHTAGHDINYIALTGALHGMGHADRAPTPPLNLVGDFGGGAMLLAFGLLAALHEAKQSGRGQVVDAAMTDGASLLASMMYGFKAKGIWSNRRESNILDGGAHFYGAYTCADGKHIAIGPIEPQFYQAFRELMGITDNALFDQQMNPRAWQEQKAALADIFLGKTRDEWNAIFEGSDACVAPILDWDEAPRHPHNMARQTFTELNGVVQPSPAPKFSRTPAQAPSASSMVSLENIVQSWEA
jgi:alpha-methylacyl-CoA racemase